jgi:hypothetical protein
MRRQPSVPAGGAPVPPAGAHDRRAAARGCRRRLTLVLLATLVLVAGAVPPAVAQRAAAPPGATARDAGRAGATRAVDVDSAGVLRWRDDRSEVALFGANYTLPSASDYRAAGSSGSTASADRPRHGALRPHGVGRAPPVVLGRLGELRLAGNLIANDHLDLQDYLIARARERGIYMLLSPIVTYEATWPDALDRTRGSPGSPTASRSASSGTSPAAIRAQENLPAPAPRPREPVHGLAYKDDPAIPFVEMVNEPCHHPDDLAGSVRYIDALVAAVRSTGSRQLLFHNVSQDFRIAEAVRRSTCQGPTFGWYPRAQLRGASCAATTCAPVDDYRRCATRASPAGRRSSTSSTRPTCAPAHVPGHGARLPLGGRAVRGDVRLRHVGTASRNLGWQTHYLSLAYTPRKALSAASPPRRCGGCRAAGVRPVPAEHALRRVPRELRGDLGELGRRPTPFLHAGDTRTRPPDRRALRGVAGVGLVAGGRVRRLGAYFLDRVRAGVWRSRSTPTRCRCAIRSSCRRRQARDARDRPRVAERVDLPDLGPRLHVQPVAAAGADPAATGRAAPARPRPRRGRPAGASR